MKKNNNAYKVELYFDSQESLERYLAFFIDGGGDGGGNIDWDIDLENSSWISNPYKMRVHGSGKFVDEAGEINEEET